MQIIGDNYGVIIIIKGCVINEKKKIVLFLAGAMLLSGINCLNSFSITGSDIVVQAAEISENIFEDGEYSYTLNEDGTAIINKCLSQDKEIKIPSQVEKDGKTYKVSKLGSYSFCFNFNYESVEIPEGIVEIEDGAFDTCYNLKSVTLPDSLVKIGSMAFNNCKIQSLTLPKNLSYIGSSAFQFSPLEELVIQSEIEINSWAFNGCTSAKKAVVKGNVKNIAFDLLSVFKSIDIDSSNESYVKNGSCIYNKDLTELKYVDRDCADEINLPESLISIGNAAFAGCDITKVNIPNSLKNIGDSAFANCSNLKEIVIPNSVISMGAYAFGGCSNLEEAKILGTVEEIKRGTFQNCYNLKEVILEEGIRKIEYSAFNYCSNLVDVELPQTLVEIGEASFQWCFKLENISIPRGVEEIGSAAFDSCNIREVEIPDSVKYMGRSVFSNCERLEKVKIPGSIDDIQKYSFENCHNLKEVSLGEGIKRFGYNAFNGCYNLKDIKLPETVVEIGEGSFRGCRALENIKIPKSVKKIDSYAFSYCNLTEVEVENGDVSLETDAFNYNPIQHITFKNCSNLDMQLEGYTQDREYAKVILNTPYGSDIQFVKYGQEVQYNSEKYALYENNQLLPFCVITENKVFELRGI